jgi:hypothetical protein
MSPTTPAPSRRGAPGVLDTATHLHADIAALRALLAPDPAPPRPHLEEQAPRETPPGAGDEHGDGHDLYPVGPSPLEEGYLEHVTLGPARVDPSARLSLTRLAAAPGHRILGSPASAVLAGVNRQAREAPPARAPAKPKKGGPT